MKNEEEYIYQISFNKLSKVQKEVIRKLSINYVQKSKYISLSFLNKSQENSKCTVWELFAFSQTKEGEKYWLTTIKEKFSDDIYSGKFDYLGFNFGLNIKINNLIEKLEKHEEKILMPHSN